MILGVVLQLLALCCMTIRTDWDGQVKKSLARLNRFLRPSEERSGGSNQEKVHG
ncbi:hypothetical protein Peur_027918 [Populus x canadensis]